MAKDFTDRKIKNATEKHQYIYQKEVNPSHYTDGDIECSYEATPLSISGDV
jgi:hypothetical protein